MKHSDLHHGHDEHSHDWAFEGPEEVERVTREGEVALPFVARILGGLNQDNVHRVLDVGPGPGVATIELARLLPQARVIALEPSASMAQAITDRAEEFGVSERIEVRTAGLPDGLDGLTDIDLIWASMSLHHVADEVNALKALRATMSNDGVIAILERSGMPSEVLLPGDVGRPGLGDRVRDAYEQYFTHMRHTLPGDVESGDFAAMVEQAGLTVLSDREQDVRHELPLTDDQRAFVATWSDRLLKQLGESLSPDDRQALNDFLDAPSRPDAPVVITRRVLLASR